MEVSRLAPQPPRGRRPAGQTAVSHQLAPGSEPNLAHPRPLTIADLRAYCA